MSIRYLPGLMAVCILAGCATDPQSHDVLQSVAAEMGGLEQIGAVNSIVRQGSGSRTLIGQVTNPGDAPSAAQITNYTEAVDLGGGRALVEYDMVFGEFQQHRREVLTEHGTGADATPVGYQVAGENGSVVSAGGLMSFSAFDTPAMLLDRSILSIVYAGVEETVTSTRPSLPSEFNGVPSRRVEFSYKGAATGLFVDDETGLVVGIEVMETDPFLGDVSVEYTLGDYREVGGFQVPHHMRIVKDGTEVVNMQYDSIEINGSLPEGDFAIPGEMAEDAETASADLFTPLELVRISAGVYHAVGSSYNSLVVEFPDHLVVVEAPSSEVQADMLNRALRDEFRLKSVEYVVATHPHPDHVGGIRKFASLGATILTEERHAGTIRNLIEARHGYNQDALHLAMNTGRGEGVGVVETFEGSHELTDGNRTLMLYAIETPHVMPMVVAYLPRERTLFESDLYSPGAPAATPDAEALLDAITALELDVDTILGGHGGRADIEELQGAFEEETEEPDGN